MPEKECLPGMSPGNIYAINCHNTIKKVSLAVLSVPCFVAGATGTGAQIVFFSTVDLFARTVTLLFTGRSRGVVPANVLLNRYFLISSLLLVAGTVSAYYAVKLPVYSNVTSEQRNNFQAAFPRDERI